MNTQIAGAAEEQSTVAEELNRSVVNISQVADETASNVAQVADSSAQLEALSVDLKQEVAKFQL